MDHFHWTGTGLLQINKALDVPVVIHKNIALVEICETQKEWSLKKITTKETRPDTSHNHQCTCLIETILEIVDCIRLVTKAALMECKDVIDIRVDS